MKFPFKNEILTGIGVGIVIMGLSYGIIKLVLLIPALQPYNHDPRIAFLIAAIPNLLIMRQWLVGKKMDKAGKGVLLVTFVSVIAVFIIFVS